MGSPRVLKDKELDALLAVLNPIREELEREYEVTRNAPIPSYGEVCTSLVEHITSVSDSQGIIRPDTEQSYQEHWGSVDLYRVLQTYGDRYYIVLHVSMVEQLISHPDIQGVWITSGTKRFRSWLEVTTDSPYKTNEYDVVYRMFISGENLYPDTQGVWVSDGWLKYDDKPIFADDICPLITQGTQNNK